MTTESVVSKAVRRGLIFSSITAVALGTAGFATAQENNGADNVERIAVTGSRIKRSDMESASPVTVIDADSLKSMGVTSIDSVLQDLTSAGGAMTNPGLNNGSQGNATIDLRGLGAQRTLVLVNGRRMIASGTGAASTVDLNTIPVSMVERIEILKDGASAVYGSDAVSGVVNIILKRDFEGFELNAQTGMSGESDAEETSIDLTLGGSFDRGNIVIGVQYTDRGEASQGDRSYSDCPIVEDDNNNLSCGGSSYTPGGTIWAEDGTYKGDDDNSWREFGDDDYYNYSTDSYLYTPMERINLTAVGTYELTDTTIGSIETTYTKRTSDQTMAPQPVWFDFEYADWMDTGADHPFEAGDELSYGRRLTDVGTRDFSQVVDTVRVVLALEGEFESGWTWDASLNYGRNDSTDSLDNLVNMGSIQEDIDTMKFNPLAQESWADLSEYVYTEQNSGGSEMKVFAASVAGELFEVPAGYVSMAAGVEYREEDAWFTPDSLTAQGLANDPATESTSGGFDVTELYAEFVVPLLQDKPFAESIEMTAAARYFDYSTFDSDYTWKLGATWRVNSELMFRGVSSTAFRAPSVDELYGGAATSFEYVEHDIAQDQAEVTVGGNEELTPEEARTITVGVVIEPEFLEGFSATVDYYSIEIDNAIAEIDSQYIVDLCMDNAGNAINTDNAVCQSSNISFDNSNRIAFDNGLQNIGSEETSGVDINFTYTFETSNIDWRVTLDTTYLSEYKVEVAGETVDYAGLITQNIGSYAEWKSNLGVSASGDKWDVNYQARYIGDLDSASCADDPSSCNSPTTGTIIYHDLSGAYAVTDSTTVRVGVNNLLDEEPPYYSGYNDSNTDPYTYDTLGRYFYASFNMKF
ncbi:TonB-dependent receptor [Ferrimonas lipolytica]|uniref:TonB-dependent receptor n=1 Tax=Ferrimonas lipolytica TaxID=2724191 RepID=A0A6H1UDM9_9GAMM|nr:TonB-dependent receptor [Ferrimonas lipolytica]QIZ76948.1 TonB-dependent receptor [Ferrimonas lipolytica]